MRSPAGPERQAGWAARLWALDLRSLAALRLAYAAILLLDLGIRAQDLVAHYTDFGVAPRTFVLQLGWYPAYWSLHMMNGTWPFQALLFALASAAALCLLVGYRTRLSTFVSWLLLISLHTRNPVVLDGGDVYLRCVLFWCMFLPWGARWSVDELRRGGPQTNEYFGFPALAYRWQLSLIYWMAAALKSGVEWRGEGSAVYYALMIEQLTTPVAATLLAYPLLMCFLTYATLAFEATGPFLFWMPGRWRTLAVAGFVTMHAGFALCLHLGVFALIGLSSTLGLLPGALWDRLERSRLARPAGRLRQALAVWPLKGAEQGGPVTAGPFTQGALAALCLYVLGWNLTTLPGLKMPFAYPEAVARCLRLDQKWGMFAPRPLVADGWYVIEAERLDGTRIDLWAGGRPPSWAKPADVAATYANARWRKFMMNLWTGELAAWRLPYGQYLTRSWNSTQPGKLRIRSFRIYFMLEETLPGGKVAPVRKQCLWQHRCF